MREYKIPTEEEINQLLQLAGVSTSDKGAKSWLEYAFVAAQSTNEAAEQRPLEADHKELLADIAKSARKLNAQLQRLRSHRHSWLEFWRAVGPGMAGAFVGRAVSEAEFGQILDRPARDTPPDHRDILSTLTNIERAAKTVKDPRNGRPRKVGKQRVVDLAFSFFVRHSSVEPSGTPTGRFAEFARAFYATAIELDPDDDVSLDRQIRE